MIWQPLVDAYQVETIKKDSTQKDILIFKHSTTCSISAMAKMRLESDWNNLEVEAYYLDLLKYRPISHLISETFDVEHESPQVLLIRNGVCIYDASHFDITVAELNETLDYHNASQS